jgi:hypothetical protein
VDDLKQILKAVLNTYSGEGLNGYSQLTANVDETMFTSVSVGTLKGRQFAFVDLLVRLVDGKIVIDEDRNSDPLVDDLVRAGIPRVQIILAYAGEPVSAPIG